MSRAVPELRFSGFEGEWKPVKISHLLDRVSLPAEVDPSKTYKEIGVRSHGKGLFHKDPVLGKTLGSKRVFYVVPRCLVLNIVFAWEQAVALTSSSEEGFIASHRFPMFRGKLDVSSIDFLFRLFLTKKGKALLEIASPGGAGRNKTLGQQAFLDLKTHVPSQAEQCKIAAFLEAVDAKLAALRKKADGLRQFKTGLMQKLFSQELRFTLEDGSDFPDWEERKLGDLVGWVRTNSLSREHLTDDDASGVQNIHYGDIHSKFRAIFRQSNEDVPFITTSAPLRTISDEDFVRPGDLVIADASEDYADIGKAVEVMEVREHSMIAGLHTFIARPKKDVLAPGFAGYLLRSAPIRRQIVRAAQGVSVLGLSKGNLEKLTLGLPVFEEQEKIASTLMAADAKIDAVTDQIASMEAFKKGLLQKMFV